MGASYVWLSLSAQGGKIFMSFHLSLISTLLCSSCHCQSPERPNWGHVWDQRVISTFSQLPSPPQIYFILHSTKKNVVAEDLWHRHIWERQSGEGRLKEENFRGSSNGVGKRFEDLILHAFGFFFLFCAIDQHDMSNCINGLLYDDKITG